MSIIQRTYECDVCKGQATVFSAAALPRGWWRIGSNLYVEREVCGSACLSRFIEQAAALERAMGTAAQLPKDA